VFDNADFGFRQITVERPLRLNFQASPERIERLREITTFQNLANSKKKDKKQAAAEEAAGREQQEAILAILHMMDATKRYKEREAFLADLEAAFDAAEVKLTAPIRKAILTALSERDETAEICRDDDGNPEPDPELRDYENVPLKESIYEYFEREVKPHVPDAWINETVRDHKDGQVGKVGYEIPLTRHFYKYTPPRPLEEIEAEIAELNRLYRSQGRPYSIQDRQGGKMLLLRPRFRFVKDRLYGGPREARLSPAAIEVLSLVAYRQPITRAEIESLRGRDSMGPLRQLVRLGLVEAVRRTQGKSRAVCYATTPRFLELFGLSSLNDLPETDDLSRL